MVGFVIDIKIITKKFAFVEGGKREIIERFKYSFKEGVKYAAKEKGKDIDIVSQYAWSFSDIAKGKNIGVMMYSSGWDIIFQASGGTGYGVIELAKENNKLVIGVDRDK